MHYHIGTSFHLGYKWNAAAEQYKAIMRDPDNINFVTILREPRSHFLSYYYYFISRRVGNVRGVLFIASNPCISSLGILSYLYGTVFLSIPPKRQKQIPAVWSQPHLIILAATTSYLTKEATARLLHAWHGILLLLLLQLPPLLLVSVLPLLFVLQYWQLFTTSTTYCNFNRNN